MKFIVQMRPLDRFYGGDYPHVRQVGKRSWIEITQDFHGVLRPFLSDDGIIEVNTRRLAGATRFAVVPPESPYDSYYIGEGDVCPKGLKKVFGRIPKAVYIRKAVTK